MTSNSRIEEVYNNLLDNVEDMVTMADGRKFGSVYLDNAKPSDMSVKSFRSYLAALSKEGRYSVVDGYAFGDVLLTTEKLKRITLSRYQRKFMIYEAALAELEKLGMSAGDADDYLAKE